MDEGEVLGRSALRLALERYNAREQLGTVVELTEQALWGLRGARTPEGLRSLRLAAYLRLLRLYESGAAPEADLKSALHTLEQHGRGVCDPLELVDLEHAQGLCLGRLGEVDRGGAKLWSAVQGNARHGRVERGLICGLDLLCLMYRSGMWMREGIQTTLAIHEALKDPEASEWALTVAFLRGGRGGEARLLEIREHILKRSPIFLEEAAL